MTERGGFEALDACVHCGFCLQACPTFRATGDESDSPRGRIELMRALERGDLPTSDPDLQLHLDRCLGCRGCEPVCPSGVGYGRGLEAARSRIVSTGGGAPTLWLARLALALLTNSRFAGLSYGLARFVRASRLPAALAGWGRARFALGMVAATEAWNGGYNGTPRRPPASPPGSPSARQSDAVLFRGCIMDGLFSHVHDATVRTLAQNGYAVRDVPGQVCCGALHAHAGLRDAACALARSNVRAFGPEGSPIVVNSAGCGALLKDYGHLLDGDPAAQRFAARVRDVTELLAERGPAPGAPLDLRVAYDPPCHLVHAQRVADAPLSVLRAIPVLRLVETPDASQCCGSAGLFTMLQPAMSRTVLAPKLSQLREAAPQIVATGNPGCIMQLGAALRAAGGAPTPVVHPVELLDASYRAAGFYA